MKLYKCSWPNGSFSFVLARDKLDAIELLDEWDSADIAWLKEVKSFMVDFDIDRAAVAETEAEYADFRGTLDKNPKAEDDIDTSPDRLLASIQFSDMTRELFPHDHDRAMLDHCIAALKMRDEQHEEKEAVSDGTLP